MLLSTTQKFGIKVLLLKTDVKKLNSLKRLGKDDSGYVA